MPVRVRGTSPSYRKLSPSELRARGLPPKSERYLGRKGDVISKRQYQQAKLAAKHGKRITLEDRAVNFFKKVWDYFTGGARRAAAARRKQGTVSRLQRRGATPEDIVGIEKLRTEPNEKVMETYMDKFGRDLVLDLISPEKPKHKAKDRKHRKWL